MNSLLDTVARIIPSESALYGMLLMVVPPIVALPLRQRSYQWLAYCAPVLLFLAGIATSARDVPSVVMFSSFTLVSFAIVYALLHYAPITGRKAMATDEIRLCAERKGITVTETVRDIPVYETADGPISLTQGDVRQYTIRRQRTTGPQKWELLMRSRHEHAQYPNGWLYKSDDGKPNSTMQKIFEEISQRDISGVMEFEGTEKTVSVYWDEDGSKEESDAVLQWLCELSKT